MANHPSALKAQRQNAKRRAKNRSHRSNLRTALKNFSLIVKEGKTEEAANSLPKLYSLVDRAVQKNVLTKNAAARHKSRLTKYLQTAIQASKQ